MSRAKPRGKDAVIQPKNRRKPPIGKPFVKGDPRINRKGRPKDHDQLRELIHLLAGEKTRVGDTQVVSLLRKMFKSRSPADRKEILEHGWGKVKDEVEHGGELTIRIVRDERSTDTPANPAPGADADQEAGKKV